MTENIKAIPVTELTDVVKAMNLNGKKSVAGVPRLENQVLLDISNKAADQDTAEDNDADTEEDGDDNSSSTTTTTTTTTAGNDGKVTKLLLKSDQSVKAGQGMLVVQETQQNTSTDTSSDEKAKKAKKAKLVNHTIKAPKDGTLKYLVAVDDAVTAKSSVATITSVST